MLSKIEIFHLYKLEIARSYKLAANYLINSFPVKNTSNELDNFMKILGNHPLVFLVHDKIITRCKRIIYDSIDYFRITFGNPVFCLHSVLFKQQIYYITSNVLW